jgi:shikimate dehydrogenase
VSRCDLAVLGDPLAFTHSPTLHHAALTALGLEGSSRAIRTPRAGLGDRLAELAREGLRGVNLTHPLKEEALAHVARVSDAARAARSVNTIGFDAGGWWGESTDGAGFMDLLGEFGRDPAQERAVLLGAGGAARGVGFSLRSAGAHVVVAARDPVGARPAWSAIPGARFVSWRSPQEEEALADATLVVNATPIADESGPAPLASIAAGALLVDMVYGEEVTPWVRAARADRRQAWDGVGMLVHQARRSLELWLAQPVPLEPLARAVGWPR